MPVLKPVVLRVAIVSVDTLQHSIQLILQFLVMKTPVHWWWVVGLVLIIVMMLECYSVDHRV